MSLSGLVDDARYGARRLARAPGFTIVAALTIAIGIGANTAIFSVLDRVLLRPLPYPEPDRLVQIWETNETRVSVRGLEYTDFAVSAQNYLDYEAGARSFEALAWTAAYGDLGLATRSGVGDGPPELVATMSVSPSFLSVLGANPSLGRNFLPEETAPPDDMRWTPVAILSHELWVRRFGADPAIIGRRILVDAGASTVVGVLPPGFEFPSLSERGSVVSRDVDVYVPLYYPAFGQPRGYRQLAVIARLRPGVSTEAARATGDPWPTWRRVATGSWSSPPR